MNETTIKEKKQLIRTQIQEVLKEDPSILLAYLFGSFSTQSLPFYDVDVGIYICEDALSKAWEKYEVDLTIQLEQLIKKGVDVVVINQAPLSMQYHITKGDLIVCKDVKLHYDLLERIWRDYFDFQPLARAMLKDLLSYSKTMEL